MRQFISSHLEGIAPIDEKRTGFGFADAVEASHQGAFARAVIAQQTNHLAALGSEAHAAQDVRIGIGKADVLNFDHFRFPPRITRYKNRGAPIKEVSAPMGSTVGAISTRDTMSDKSSSTPPHRALQGMRKR